MLRKSVIAAAAIAIVLFAVACQPVTSPPPTPDAASVPLVGTEWQLNEMQGEQSVHDATVSANFSADGQLTGQAGCNDYSTRYEIDGTSMTIDPDFESGMNECAEEIMAIESVYLGSLQNVVSYEIVGQVLFMRNGDDDATLVFDAVSD